MLVFDWLEVKFEKVKDDIDGNTPTQPSSQQFPRVRIKG